MSAVAEQNDERTALRSEQRVNESSNPLLENITQLNVRARMVALLVAGSGIALVQHGLYSYVDGQPVDTPLFPYLPHMAGYSNQSAVSFLGTQISKLAVIFLCAAISLACTQVFWWRLGVRHMTIRQINAVEGLARQPLNVFTWRASVTYRLVTFVVLCQALIDFVSTITPGSVTVSTIGQRKTCTVHTVDLAHSALMRAWSKVPDDPIAFANGGLLSVVARAIVAGANFAPQSPCGICEYSLQFSAPGARCEDITQRANFSDAAPAYSDSSNAGYTVWDGQITRDNTLLVKSRDMMGTWSPAFNTSVGGLPVMILNCSGWNIQYDVSVNHTIAGANVTVHNQTYQELLSASIYSKFDELPYPTLQSLALWRGFTFMLNSTIQYNAISNRILGEKDYVAHSPLIGNPFTNGFAWKWAGNLTELIPQLMWNVNLALLSGELTATNATLASRNVDCRVVNTLFVYNRTRLFVTYGVAVATSVACVACGFLATRFHGRGESSGFSRTLAAYPSSPLPLGSDLTPDTKVELGKDGRLRVVEEKSGDE